MGAKFFVVLALAIVMSIPAMFVSWLAYDRAEARGALTSEATTAPTEHHSVLGIRLADSYRSTQRSLKYITLFLGLVFLTYFILEVHTGKRVHPGQYALVGIGQVVFYLLLLSLSERIGFDLAFLIAGAATVVLFAFNVEWVFVSRKLGLRALAAFSTLYTFIYVLLRLEDYALLIGSIASFTAIAATMYFTRGVDWYSSTGSAPLQPAPAGHSPAQRDSWLE
jgi:inner membrane protein